MEEVDCIVVGAGVVGLAVARQMAQQGLETLLLERETAIGTATSSRNSEVIHAGIYYPPGSLKAQLCVRGRDRLYDYCQERSVPHRRCGKLIVASSAEQESELLALQAAGAANGVDDLRLLSRAEALALEPELACTAALFSPSTGIVDSHALMLSLRGDFEAAGGMIAFGARVARGDCAAEGITLDVAGDEPMRLRAARVINCAGLHAQELAASLQGLPARPAWSVPPRHLAKGNYFSLARRSPFSHLIYPVPEPGGLGVHLTLDLAGQARFGPDVEWVEALHYPVDASRGERFYGSIRRYWPGLPDGALQPAYSGIRPKLSGPGEPARDFLIQGEADHGVPGLVHLFGIESPGLTSSLAIAERVAELLAQPDARR